MGVSMPKPMTAPKAKRDRKNDMPLSLYWGVFSRRTLRKRTVPLSRTSAEATMRARVTALMGATWNKSISTSTTPTESSIVTVTFWPACLLSMEANAKPQSTMRTEMANRWHSAAMARQTAEPAPTMGRATAARVAANMADTAANLPRSEENSRGKANPMATKAPSSRYLTAESSKGVPVVEPGPGKRKHATMEPQYRAAPTASQGSIALSLPSTQAPSKSATCRAAAAPSARLIQQMMQNAWYIVNKS